ncbi:MAG: SUMF1/EgtB/PvdO family nonheme iron enzyme [Flavobacteriales bacterium]|nr:SUMF1/EgtB/PvdO family nonheme iron enzyme [Flavobacteriales bacterium]
MKQLAVGMIWLLQALNLQAQDTVLSKETRVVQVTNSYLKHQVHSRHLRTTRPPDDTTFSSLDPEVVKAIQSFVALPDLKLNDCLLFKPYESYVAYDSLVQHDDNGSPRFVLDRTYGWEKFYLRTSSLERLILPTSLRSYFDTADLKVEPGQLQLRIASDAVLPINDYLRPFYFRKYEVTNQEYRYFVEWVRDSIARRTLYDAGFESFGSRTSTGEVKLNWSAPIEWQRPERKEVLQMMFIPEGEFFYRRNEVDTRKLNYVFASSGEPSGYRTLNIYPDTLIWVNDFTWSLNEPMTEGYFWHPRYDDHPVVGVTYWQALAYLHWRTMLGQQLMDRKGLDLRIRYDLPNEMQWDMVAASEMENERPRTFGKNYTHWTDTDWITDLHLIPQFVERTDSLSHSIRYMSRRRNGLFDVLNQDAKFDGVLVMDGAFHPTKCNIDLIEKKGRNPLVTMQKSPTGISYLGGNVSEWLKDSYSSWKAVFELRQVQLATFEEEDIRILSTIERYWDRLNDPDGRMVRGANWFDERFSDRFGVNTAGTNAKVFVAPDRAHSTLGFRYVVYVESKENDRQTPR